jgi:glycosyltransferase involved in cell wall biosynthesis
MSLSAKICLSTQEYPPHIGGVAVAAQRLTRNLASAGFRVHVVTPCDTPGSTGEIRSAEEDGAIVHRLFHDYSNPQGAFAFRQLIRHLDEEVDFDLFHGFFLTAVYPCVAIAEARGRRRPVIASIRGNDALTLINHPYTRGAILAALRKATWVTSVNELYLRQIGEEVDVTGRCSVIRNSVAPSPESARPWLLDDKNRGVVGTVGQLRRVKDIPLLIRGYAGVRAELRRVLLLAGYFDDPEEESWSQVLAEEFGLMEQIKLTGRFAQPDVFDHLRAMHVYVQSSAYEGLPNALLEAARLGVPLVATAVGGLREVLVDGESALLVPHGEPTQMAQAIEQVLDDDDLARHLSIGARRLAENLSPEREWSEWLALYVRLIEMV